MRWGGGQPPSPVVRVSLHWRLLALTSSSSVLYLWLQWQIFHKNETEAFSLEATAVSLKESVWRFQGKGHFFTPLKRVDNSNRKSIRHEKLHFPGPLKESATQLWSWYREPVHWFLPLQCPDFPLLWMGIPAGKRSVYWDLLNFIYRNSGLLLGFKEEISRAWVRYGMVWKSPKCTWKIALLWPKEG